VRLQAKEASLVCQLADRLFGEFEQWRNADNAQLTVVKEQVKLLHLSKPSGTPSTSGSRQSSVVAAPAPSRPSQSAPEPLSTSDLIEPIRQLVIETIHKELKLCFDNLRFRCIENQQKLATEMEEEAKKIMLDAEIVKSRLTPSREPSVRPVIPSNQSNLKLVALPRAPPF